MTGIYIHIPFCLKKCHYCAFNSFSGKESIMAEYTDAVIKEIRAYPALRAGTLYIGGGTPTCMPTYLLEKIIASATNHFSFDKDSEITIEANPKTITKESLAALRGAGINRVSLGVQSLSDAELAAIGRAHSAADALCALELIRDSGFENFSVDIMSALPGQTLKTLTDTVTGLLKYYPTHFSAYSLSIDEGTYFEAHPPLGLPGEDEEREMYRTICAELCGAGYGHYEISNFALPGFEARHNTNYWLGGEYIGIGAGAHSYFEGVRFENEALPEKYIINPHARLCEYIIDDEERKKEYYMLGLRLLDGVPEQYHENLESLIENGLIKRENGKILLTERGIDISNYVMAQLM